MTGTITSLGVGSGLDVTSIISKLMEIEQQPIQTLETQTTAIKTQLSAYGKLSSAISTFRDAASATTKGDTWSATKSTSSDDTAVSVTAGTAAPGSYAVSTAQLASSQTVASGVIASSTALGTGTLHIELGSYSDDQSSFTAKSGVVAVDVTIGEGEDTLAKVAQKINQASAGVTASIVSDINGSRLVLRSTNTGKDNAFRITSTGLPGTGLADLNYDPAGGQAGLTLSQKAQNAFANVNGIDIESDSNSLTGAVEGLTIKLNKVTTSPVDISVEQDDDAIKGKLQAFVDAYNSLNSLLAADLKYDAGTKEAGPLQGDRTAVTLQSQFRQLLTGMSGASTKYGRLSDVGIEVQKDGSLTLNASKLTAALDGYPAEIKKLFANADTTTTGSSTNDGIAQRLRQLADQVLGVDGSISMRTTGLQNQINRNNTREQELQDRADRTEARLKAQYSALDTTLSNLNGLSSYVTNQLAALSNNS